MKKPLATKKSKVRVPDMTNPSKFHPSLFDSARCLSDLDTCEKVRLQITMYAIPEEMHSLVHSQCDDGILALFKRNLSLRFVTKGTMSEGR